ncbi:MAG: hypothetical protein KR126chlam6_01496 [Candidatus Anoxychlamydiales bacterium]|nr:hypothetical protein [Candidatus Anoxychlamydiales bacterium]
MSVTNPVQGPSSSSNTSTTSETTVLIHTERKTQDCCVKAMKLLIYTLGGTAAGTLISMLIDSSDFTQLVVFEIGGSMLGLGLGMHQMGIK